MTVPELSPLDVLVDEVRAFAAHLAAMGQESLVGPHAMAERLEAMADRAVSRGR